MAQLDQDGSPADGYTEMHVLSQNGENTLTIPTGFTTALASFQPQPAAAATSSPTSPLKIMFIGDSITYGSGGATALPGFREHVWAMLRAKRGDVSFIGTIVDGSPSASKYVLGEWEHEGYSGDTIEGRSSVIAARIATTGAPDIAVVMVGTNNCGTDTAAQMLVKLTTLLQTIRGAASGCTLVVCSIPPFTAGADAAKHAVRNTYNAGLSTVVAAFQNAYYVDACAGMTAGDQNTDGIHPTHFGNARIAENLTPVLERIMGPPRGPVFPDTPRARPAQASLLLAATTDVASAAKSALEVTSGSFYVEFWYYPTSLPSGNNVLWSQGPLLATSIIIAQNSDGISLFTEGTAWLAASTMPGTLRVNQWHHIVCHWDSAGSAPKRCAVWVNGMLRGTVQTVTPAWNIATGVTTRIGNFSGVATSAFGLIDNLRMGAGSSVPAYKSMRPYVEAAYLRGESIPGLVGQYKIDENTGTSLADVFGGTALTVSGATWATRPKPFDLTLAGAPQTVQAVHASRIVAGYVPLTYSATIATDASSGNFFSIVATNGTAYTISSPTNASVGQTLTYDIKNSSGGAMGAITWGAAFLLAGAFTNPASTKRRTISFVFDGTNWVETNRAAADI